MYRIISLGPRFFKINQGGYVNTFIINLVTRTTLRVVPAATSQENQEDDVRAAKNVLSNAEDKKEARKYFVDRIIRHADIPDRTRYVIRWYWYGEKDDTTKRAENIPQHLRGAY